MRARCWGSLVALVGCGPVIADYRSSLLQIAMLLFSHVSAWRLEKSPHYKEDGNYCRETPTKCRFAMVLYPFTLVSGTY